MDSGKMERIQRCVRIRSIAQAAPPPVRHVPGRSTPRPFMDVSVEPRSQNTDLRKCGRQDDVEGTHVDVAPAWKMAPMPDCTSADECMRSIWQSRSSSWISYRPAGFATRKNSFEPASVLECCRSSSLHAAKPGAMCSSRSLSSLLRLLLILSFARLQY